MLSTPARSRVRACWSRPRSRRREPRSRSAPALVGDDEHRRPDAVPRPRPTTCTVRARKTTYGSKPTPPQHRVRGHHDDGLDGGIRRASATTGVACTASARSSAEQATPHPATIQASRLSTSPPRRRRWTTCSTASDQGDGQHPGRSPEGRQGREPRDGAEHGARRSTR